MNAIVILFRLHNYNLHFYPESGTFWNGNDVPSHGGWIIDSPHTAGWQVSGPSIKLPQEHFIVAVRI